MYFVVVVQKKLENKSSQFIIPDLSSSTLYCLKVQAFAPAYNKSSEFSSETCTKTAKGMKYLFLVFDFLKNDTLLCIFKKI